MKYNPNIHKRKSIRLKGYDYSQAGLYFVTICCFEKMHLFGEIIRGKMQLNTAGEIAKKCWLEIPQHFNNTKLHEFVIMPNHVHGIIEIICSNNQLPNRSNVDGRVANNDSSLPMRSPSKTIGSMIRGYKIGVTKWFRGNMMDTFPVGQSVWQRNYYEHIIRNEKALFTISDYIINNPLKWEEDKFYS